MKQEQNQPKQMKTSRSLSSAVGGVGAFGATLLILNSSLATAAAGSYQFGGSCGSQGPWTQQALQKTSELRGVLSKLQALPECKVYATQMQASLDKVQGQLSLLDQDRQATSTASQLPGQVDALRSSLATDQSNKSSVLGTMFNLMIDSARNLQPELKIATSVTDPTGSAANAALGRADNSSLIRQVSQAAGQSLQMFNETIDYLPQVQGCLGKENLVIGGQIMSASVQILSALAGGNSNGNSLHLAKAISKLTNYLREAPFANALKILNRNEMAASLACLLETTSENYCNARDAHLLFDQLTDQDEIESNASGELRLKSDQELFRSANEQNSPLAGYFLLTQNVPIITDWLQMIQLGAEPRLATDADQKNLPINQIASFQMTTNTLKASLNSQLENIRNYTTFDEKQNAVYAMAVNLYQTVSGFQAMGQSQQQNFYTLAMQPVDILFYLLGLPTPDAVRPSSGMIQTPDSWLQNNYKNLPAFSDPMALGATIATNLNRLIEQASRSSVTYYNKWFIVDKVLVTNRALIGINYNVKNSLQNTRSYLDNLQSRVQKYSPNDLSMVPLILETKDRLDKVLKRFHDLEALGKVTLTANSTQNVQLQAQALSESLIAEVYNQFYVMLGKSGWLASRMADFVTADFLLMRRAGLGLDPYLNDIYAASGRLLGDELVRMSNSNPAAVKTDLSMALYLGKGNLAAISTGLADAYLDQIALLQQVVEGRHFSDATTLWQTEHPEELRLVPTVEHYPDENPITNNGVAQVISGIYRSYLGSFGDLSRLYQRTSNVAVDVATPAMPLSPDDEFGSAKALQAQFCIQTLAFANLGPFWPLCKQTELVSPYAKTPKAADAPATADSRFVDLYNVNYRSKAWQDYKEKGREANLSQRICAFRDYNRRNLILYLTKNTK